jgi:hypothetical protein
VLFTARSQQALIDKIANLPVILATFWKSIFLKLFIYDSAANISGLSRNQRGLSRSPALLNTRSQLLLVAGIARIPRASFASLSRVVRSCHQYSIGSLAKG